MTAADTVKDLHVRVKRCPECGTGFGREAAFCPFDGSGLKTSTWDPTRDPLTDTVVDHRYEVVEPLGEGGMGTVYKVRHMTLDRPFAMKVLRRDLAADTGLAARFLQEARATAAIHHPSVVAINDFGKLDDGAPYFVMELLVGETLSTRLAARGLLAPSEAAGIAAKLADGLAAAHAANVVHRDLKPENIFLVGAATGKAATDDVRIVDFGAAKIVGGSKLTRPGVVFGTPYYMSPEQASGEPVDARADVYSLGVLLYEMVTGKLPFEADTYMGVLTKHMFAAPPKPSELIPAGVQLGDLEAVVLRALEKDPRARFQSMVELRDALDRAVHGPASSAPRVEKTRSGRPLAFTAAMSTADKIQQSVTRHVEDERRRQRRTIGIAAVAAAATLAMSALAVVIIDDAGRSKDASVPPAAETQRAALTSTAASAPAAPPSAPVEPEPDPARVVVPPPAPPPTAVGSAPVSPPPPRPTLATRPKPPPVETAPKASASPAPRPVVTSRSPDDLPDPWQR